MSGSRSFHTTRKAQVITFLLSGETVSDAALKAGVAERTVYRWLANETFQDELHQEERQVLNSCSFRLVSLTRKALDALEDVLKEPSQRGAGNKRLAAGAVLELALKYMDVLTLEERIRKLESMVFHE